MVVAVRTHIFLSRSAFRTQGKKGFLLGRDLELESQRTRYLIFSFVVLRTLKRVAGLVLDRYE
jgi:hypothetical protein